MGGFRSKLLRLPRRFARSQSTIREWLVLLVAVVAAAGVFLERAIDGRSAREVDGPTAAINYPEANSSVPYRVRVAGTSVRISDQVNPWLFVQATDGDLYPQGGDDGGDVEINRSSGDWCGYAYFGEAKPRAAGREYSLILALPTDPADRKLDRRMRAPGVLELKNLPGGFERLAAVGELVRTREVPSEAQLAVTSDCR